MSMMLSLAFLAAIVAPVGLDSHHIPQGSPLGNMPIRIAPGESPELLQKPLSESEFWRRRRALIDRANRDPRMRAIARRIAEKDRIAADEDRKHTDAGQNPR